jgi:transposase
VAESSGRGEVRGRVHAGGRPRGNGRQDIVSPSRPGSRTEGEDGEGGRQDRLQNLADRQMQRCNRFVALSKRSIVEWTFASISRNRRLARNFERGARSVAAFVRLAMIRRMLKRLTNPTLCA